MKIKIQIFRLRVLHSSTHKESARFRNCRVQKKKNKKKRKEKKSPRATLFFQGESNQKEERGQEEERSKTETRIDICITRRR